MTSTPQGRGTFGSYRGRGGGEHGQGPNREFGCRERLWGDWPERAARLLPGRLNLDPPISKRYFLSQVDEAFHDMEAGGIMFEGK